MRFIKALFLLLFIGMLIYSCGTESKPTYTLSTSVTGDGSISPSNGEFKDGEEVTITATPSENRTFNKLNGDIDGTTNTMIITINNDIK